MKLYHLTDNLAHDGSFVPAVPFIRLEGENDTTKRISTSLSLEGCLTAMPKGGGRLDQTVKETGGHFRLFEFDTEQLNVPPEAVIMPYTLTERGWVMDALQTEEVWLTVPLQATRTQDIMVSDWQEYEDDLVPNWFRPVNDQTPVLTVIEQVHYHILKEMMTA